MALEQSNITDARNNNLQRNHTCSMEGAANKHDSVSDVDLREMLQLQLSEVEMLSSMFANPGEFLLEDPTCLAEIQEFTDASVSYDKIQSRIGFTVKVNRNDDGKVRQKFVLFLLIITYA